jgi:uracil-DNA glycosylase
MSLRLDARQRAMLEEMGIKLFWPEESVPQDDQAPVGELAAAPVAAPQATMQPQPAAPVARAPLPAGGPEPALVLLQWDPQKNGGTVLPADAEIETDWLVLTDGAGDGSDIGGSLAAQATKLLDNMLLATGLTRRDRVVVCHLVQARGGEPDALAQFEPAIRRQVQRLRPRLLLVMGRLVAQSLLQTGEPLGRLRGRAHDYSGVPAVVSYAPVYLLRNGADKAKAWADLCLAQALLRERG